MISRWAWVPWLAAAVVGSPAGVLGRIGGGILFIVAMLLGMEVFW